MAAENKIPAEIARELRVLAHDLSNSLETILQAAYLLQQAKLETAHKKWAQMIDTAARDAAHTNREIRKVLQAQSSVGPQSSSRADAKSDN